MHSIHDRQRTSMSKQPGAIQASDDAGARPPRRSRVPVLAFDESVYGARIARLQSAIDERGLSGVLLFDPENLYWLTGFQTIGYFTFQAAWFPRDGAPVIVSRIVNRDLALAHTTIGAFEAVHDTEAPVDVLAHFLSRCLSPGARVGIETSSRYLSVRDYAALRDARQAALEDFNGVIEPWRRVKTAQEIERMRRAARAAEQGLAAAIEAVAPGRTENDVAAAMLHANIGAGSEYLGHPPLVVAGEATSLCFAMWQRREIRAGDVVLLEAAGCVDRYHAMLSRPVVAGKPQPEHVEAAAALEGVLEAAIESIAPGRTAGEVDALCRRVVEQRGLADYFRHRAAYGIGIGFPPNWSEGHIYAIRPGDPLVLEPNMTFHVIPTLFKPTFGMCFSDSVRVTDSGCELLTDFPRRLFSAA